MRKRRLAVSAALTISLTALSQTTALAAGTPGTPTNLSTTPAPVAADGTTQACGTGVAYSGLENIGGIPQVVLSATLQVGSDNAGTYSAAFQATDETTGTTLAPIDSAGQVAPGTTVSVDLPVTDGHSYSWTVAETDGTSWSAAAGPCAFTSDTSSPYNPTVTSTDFPTSGGGLESGEPGSFTVTSSDPAPAAGSASGLRGYSYVFDGTLGSGGAVTPANADGSLTLSGRSFTWGMHTLSVRAVDNADNYSSVTQYSFYVAQSPELTPALSLSVAGPGSVNADGSDSTGLSGETQCTFDFGDQTAPVTMMGPGCNAGHEYFKDGTYPVTLTIADQNGHQQSVTKDFTTPGLSQGTLFHEVLGGTRGFAAPAGSTGIAQSSITAMPNGSSQLVAVTTAGTLEHNIRNANGSWQGWRGLPQSGVTATNAGIAGMPNGSSQLIEVTSDGGLKHDIRNADGTWQKTGWGSPAGSTGITQAAITAMPDGSSQLVAVTTSGVLEHNIRYANGSWQGWRTLNQPGVTVTDASIAGMPNGSSQIIEVTSTGILKHDIRNADGTWQKTGWGSPAGSTGISQASITALPDGSSEIVALNSIAVVQNSIRHANGSWTNWGLLAITPDLIAASNTSIAGMPNNTAQIIEVSSI